ncbi:MAG: cation transporter dimerization domain-containing protein, partial [Oscillospiraceae bacterium]|nr:cation transporter dimerization domain-containing protein [Oscillospiraceae bacterium]
FILWSGVGIAKDTIAPLLGESASPELKALVAREVTAHEKVLGMHDLMVHDYGPNQKFATVHVEMAAKEDPLVCHNIIDNIERRMLAQHHIHLTIHYDPVVSDDAELQEIRALLTKTLQAIDPGLSLHDLRMVRGPEHTNLVFDLVVPAALQGERAALQAKINASLPQDAGHRYYTVITYDSPDFN